MCAALSSYTLEDQERMASAANYFAWQHRLVTRELSGDLGRRVIEIGCGIGNFTGLLLDNREVVVAIDVEPGCIERLKQRYPARANLHPFARDVMDPAFIEIASFRADSCVCLNVLEHIEDDREALRRMAAVLVPGGVVLLIVPAFPSLYGPIDRQLGHHRRYTRASIRTLAEAAGLTVKKAHYLNAIGFFGWWTNAHILKRQAQSAAQIQVFDRYIVPIASRIEHWMHPPFGQSLFIVLKKPL
jgi:2-polyprenyl-3-methyl-5-hydroxy-6-metoxy-1,4-benzoquinol methylase